MTVRHVNHDVVVHEHTYGGAEVHSSGSQCTTGFTVESLFTAETGVTTAAHCAGMTKYVQPQGGPTYTIDFEGEHEGLFGEVAWYTSPDHLDAAEYYADFPDDLRQVNSVETSVAVNNFYCVYSRMQGTRACDTVYAPFVAVYNSSGVIIAALVGMTADNTIGGDSGGPWSYSTEATGIHSGDVFLGFSWRNIFSVAKLLPAALLVSVITQP